jgi:hypothetical protein
MVNQRAAIAQRMRQAFELIQEAADIAEAAHLGMPRVTLSTGYGRHADGLCIATARIKTDSRGKPWTIEASPQADLERLLRLGIDTSAWQYLMHESGLRTFMDAEARKKWDQAVSEGDIPEFNEGNVRSTFTMLHDARGEMFERGVIACFKGLAWDYKTNLPQKFGKRIVIRFLRYSVSSNQWGASSLGSVNYGSTDRLDDLARVFHVLDGKPEPDVRQGWYKRLSAVNRTSDPDAADDYMTVRSFRNGNGHVTFKRPDLVDRMNKIIARHYPGALPAPK